MRPHQRGHSLSITATEADPFTIEVVTLIEGDERGILLGLEPGGAYRWRIFEVAQLNAFNGTIEGFASEKFAIDLDAVREFHPFVRDDDFWLELDSGAIYLNARIVPESGALAIMLLAFAATCGSAPLGRTCR